MGGGGGGGDKKKFSFKNIKITRFNAFFFRGFFFPFPPKFLLEVLNIINPVGFSYFTVEFWNNYIKNKIEKR